MPEDALLDVLRGEDLVCALSLGMALNYQRNSYTLWTAVRALSKDPSTRWAINPKLCTRASIDELRAVLTKHKVALQPNRHVANWSTIAQVITTEYNGSFLRLLADSNYSVATLSSVVQVSQKRQFPYLSGPKLFNYWLYVMEQYCGIAWTDRELISVAPDTHVCHASRILGLVNQDAGPTEVAQAWDSLLKGSDLVPIDVHTPLWLWSRAGCPTDMNGIPIANHP